MTGKAALLAVVLLIAPQAADAQSCPALLATARRLVLVTAATMTTPAATLRRFERAEQGAPWQEIGGAQSVLIGYKGMAWAHAFRSFARAGEPVKVDGDKRAPAGFYPIGRSFGFAPSSRPGYLRLREGTVCVDDPASRAYNVITTRAAAGWKVHGENMWRISAYRHGLVVDYPTDARARAGSCIFIHVRLPNATGTNGCVAAPETEVETLQDFAQSGAVLAVLPENSLGEFSGCLPAAAR